MKVLHTSDWHLGQQFYEHSRTHEQQAFLDWLAETLVSQNIDLLLIAGDIYHTATPPASAEQQLYTFIKQVKLTCPELHIVIIAGNHDSANRIETAKPLLQLFDTHVVGRFDKQAPEQVIKPIETKNGTAHVVAMPFLRVSDISMTSDISYQQAVAQAYDEAIESAKEKLRTEHEPLIVMGHLHAKGGDISSDSERNIAIGGFESINASIFTQHADYVALGHLHKAQSVAKSEHIRYSGTPLPMSFSERNYRHQVVVAEFAGKQLTSVKPLYVPRHQQLLLLPERGSADLNSLCEMINALEFDTEAPPSYVRLRLNSSETNSQFRAIIDEALKDKPILFCGIERVSEQSQEQHETFTDLGQVEQLDPMTLLALAFAQQVDANAPVPDALKDCLAHVINAMDEEPIT
ncbi:MULTISPECIES: exonuclease SbcCD subunit D C-terminal domain-containing protein [Pseudoalteromonas]|uniref:Nuclease SbcCD subunit D n=1 Tax=Pseudoalteromonas amylolytica TaxID=1859457 RepID=A0A1S1MP96_9GAMM|nr:MULTISPECIES: exonuclease SbcCD subunit D C-terminal domain-containing protein [Pseudoalteromonas]OHU85077.1 exonuclease sbcCD subunit D [Pseudoalteromonas sp. JW3]OHU89971.1 exonuclease sbcCD subunit D [Pseudoalteromonas amylolytica]